MTPEQIRGHASSCAQKAQYHEGQSCSVGMAAVIVMLAEIAAQLAELNSRLPQQVKLDGAKEIQ